MRKYWERGSETELRFKNIFFFGLILLTTGLFSCGANNEGCLDAIATNFDVSADANCCCVYPKMGIEFDFFNGTNAYSPSFPFGDEAGDSFYIEKIKFFISDVSWTLEDNMVIRSDTRLWLYPASGGGNDSIRSIDDYYLIDPTKNNLSNFTFTELFKLKKLRFLLGVADSASTNLPLYIKNINHPLADSDPDSMYNEVSKQYMTMRIQLKNYKNSGLTDTLYYLDGPDAMMHFEYPITNSQIKLGMDNNVTVEIQLNKLFEGIRLREQTTDMIISKLKNNAKNIFL